jgi:hypothetical protein
MGDMQRYPLLVFALSLFGLWLSVLIGAFLLGRVRPVKESERQDLDFVVSASLTLLALIIGFAFSMSVSRYDMRKNYEEEEANAIGTEYARADLLQADAAAKVRQLLVQYLNERVLFYTVQDEQQLNSIAAGTTKLQNEMWSTARELNNIVNNEEIAELRAEVARMRAIIEANTPNEGELPPHLRKRR